MSPIGLGMWQPALVSAQALTQWHPPRLLLLSVRVALLLSSALLAMLVHVLQADAVALGLLSLVALMSSLPLESDIAARLQPVAAGVLAALIIALAAPVPAPLLPYLLSPVVSAGLVGGITTAITTAGLAAGAEFAATVITVPSAAVVASVAASAPWMLFTVAVGLLAAWVRRLELRPSPKPDPSYAAAYRLLSQLRYVSRQLSGGLDPVTLAQGTLQTLQERLSPNRSACLVRPSDNGHLVAVAALGEGARQWCATLEEDTLVQETWLAAALTTSGRHRNGAAFTAGLPLRMGVRTFGVIALQWDAAVPDRASLLGVQTALDESALRLGTGLLFSEIRDIATAEERRRLAREIHDGIAQELASLGYAIDDLAARLPETSQVQVARLRGELSRIVGELRLSIFDLRSGVEDAGGLGTAISDYVQQVGATSDLRVHLVLDEGQGRLPQMVEAELFRIVQEAVTNVRRHADAQNLWVTCTIDPPNVQVAVEDDGCGLGDARWDSFGLTIMKERAARVGGKLKIMEREPGGTRVVCDIHGPRESSQRRGLEEHGVVWSRS